MNKAIKVALLSLVFITISWMSPLPFQNGLLPNPSNHETASESQPGPLDVNTDNNEKLTVNAYEFLDS